MKKPKTKWEFIVSCVFDGIVFLAIGVIITCLVIFISNFQKNMSTVDSKINNQATRIDEIGNNINVVDSKINSLRAELEQAKAELLISLDELYSNDANYSKDKNEIVAYVNNFAMKSELTRFEEDIKSAVENNSYVSSVMHANIYRGKFLGEAVSEQQIEAIRNGTFDDLFVGDYWTINDIDYRIADIDYFFNLGDTSFTNHHLVIVPDQILYNAKMNDTATNVGGYPGSKMYIEYLKNAREKINADFENLILIHKDYFISDLENYWGDWFDSTIDLMSESMVYGQSIYSKEHHPIGKTQFSLFRLSSKILYTGNVFWLRSNVGSDGFADVGGFGDADFSPSDYSFGVRPYFCIG